MKTDFEPGDIIDFCGDHYEVIKNHGDSGEVKALNDGNLNIHSFRWVFEGEPCHLVKRAADKEDVS